jgi:hypothetical protein
MKVYRNIFVLVALMYLTGCTSSGSGGGPPENIVNKFINTCSNNGVSGGPNSSRNLGKWRMDLMDGDHSGKQFGSSGTGTYCTNSGVATPSGNPLVIKSFVSGTEMTHLNGKVDFGTNGSTGCQHCKSIGGNPNIEGDCGLTAADLAPEKFGLDPSFNSTLKLEFWVKNDPRFGGKCVLYAISLDKVEWAIEPCCYGGRSFPGCTTGPCGQFGCLVLKPKCFPVLDPKTKQPVTRLNCPC